MKHFTFIGIVFLLFAVCLQASIPIKAGITDNVGLSYCDVTPGNQVFQVNNDFTPVKYQAYDQTGLLCSVIEFRAGIENATEVNELPASAITSTSNNEFVRGAKTRFEAGDIICTESFFNRFAYNDTDPLQNFRNANIGAITRLDIGESCSDSRS